MKLGIGTVQFGLPYGIANAGAICTDNELNSILMLAHSNHLKIIDTAPGYGNAERRLGKSGLTSNFNIVSKIEHLEDDDEAAMKRQGIELIERSIVELCVQRLYGVICHDPKALVTEDGFKTLAVLEHIKAKNMCKKIGVSIYEVEDVSRIIRQGGIDLVQLPLNLFDQRFLTSGALAVLKANGIEIHIRSAFLQGLLLMPLDKVKIKKPEAYQAMLRLHQFSDDVNLTPLELSMHFIQSIAEVDHIIVGATNTRQLQEIITAMETDIASLDYGHLSVNELAIIDPRKW